MVEPWKVEGNPWGTESKFITWIRGVLRKGWSKHPLKIEYIKRYRKRIKNPNEKASKRFPEVWGMTCECCKVDTVQAEIEIDHKGEQGKFTTLSEIYGYAKHLFMIDYDSIRAVCKNCHRIISQSQRSGVSFEEAKTEKFVILFAKLPAATQVEILSSLGCKGKTKEARVALYKQLIADGRISIDGR